MIIKSFFSKGGKRGLDAQRQRLEGAHCISATCIQLNSCLWHLLPSGKYGIAILERFDIPGDGESVKSGGKKDLSLPLYPLLYVTICERQCESPICPDNISNCRCTYVFRNCISSSSWLDICELQIHLHRCTHCHLDGCKVSLGSSAPREECGGHEGWPWVLPSSAFSAVGGGSPAVPQPSFRDFVASRTYEGAPAPPGRALEPAFWRH